VAEKIEAFIQGPVARPPQARHSRVRARTAPPLPPAVLGAPIHRAHLPQLDSRADWNLALRLEAARHERYARPVALVVIDVVVTDEIGYEPSRSVIDALAGALGQMLREMTRETDRIARFGPTRFNVLLPETSRAEARRFAERAREAAETGLVRGSLTATLRIALASPGPDEALTEALALAEAQLAG
jgi:diguanylate cyclase (GGDEF)-like protein